MPSYYAYTGFFIHLKFQQISYGIWCGDFPDSEVRTLVLGLILP